MPSGRKAKSKKLSEPPTCSCLLLCDDVVVSHARDKHVLQGVIGAMAVQIPGKIGGFVAYLRISNIYQTKKVKVRFEFCDTGDVLWELEADMVSTSPLQVATLVARVPPFLVQRAGRHMLTVLSDNVPLAQTPISVQDLEAVMGAEQ